MSRYMGGKWEQYVAMALELGREHGKASGTWMFDGNSDEAYIKQVLKGYEDGDPLIMDMQPSPLSGEWADSMTPAKLLEELGVSVGSDGDDDELCDAYEEGYVDGYWEEVQRSGKARLG